MNTHQVLLYYQYVKIADPAAYMAEQRALCESLDLLGRIIVGAEGINGTVSGTVENTNAYIDAMHADERTAQMPFKIDAADEDAFPKLSVKVRDEVVALGLDPEQDIDPNEVSGKRLSPKEFYEAMQDENIVLIDARNDYESKLGHFKGALCPDLRNFRDFPEWVDEHVDELKGKKILTYCTGGIRCEKFSGLLKQKGLDDVSQLDGGIVNYGKDEATQGRDFDGECYVFDQRVKVPVNFTDTATVISHCLHCGTPSTRYRNCPWSPCNEQIFLCESCEDARGRHCSAECEALTAEAAATAVVE